MATTTLEAGTQLITFTLPAIPESVPAARFQIRATLSAHQLDEYQDDAAIITSELVTNAIQHADTDTTRTIRVTLTRARNPEAVTITVTDSSAHGPVTRTAPDGSERGRGLRIISELSDRWGWHPQDSGKAVYAVLVKHGSAR